VSEATTRRLRVEGTRLVAMRVILKPAGEEYEATLVFTKQHGRHLWRPCRR
jgi:hypothetical protein